MKVNKMIYGSLALLAAATVGATQPIYGELTDNVETSQQVGQTVSLTTQVRKDQSAVDLTVSLGTQASEAQPVVLNLYNEAGSLINTYTYTVPKGGKVFTAWFGLDYLPTGQYSVEAKRGEASQTSDFQLTKSASINKTQSSTTGVVTTSEQTPTTNSEISTTTAETYQTDTVAPVTNQETPTHTVGSTYYAQPSSTTKTETSKSTTKTSESQPVQVTTAAQQAEKKESSPLMWFALIGLALVGFIVPVGVLSKKSKK